MPEVNSSIFHLQKLEVLNVRSCNSLKSLSSNTCSPALRELNALYCYNLQELSVTFSSVDGLTLFLTKWNRNELPSSILHTKNLKEFVFPISDCLVDLPENFCNTICLACPQNSKQDPFITLDKILSSPAFLSVKDLIFYDIPIMSEIPNSISLLSSLETLTLIDMAIKSLPETIMYLPRLKRVDIYDCKLLQSIPAPSRCIPNLIVCDCESLEKVLSSTGEQYYKPSLCFIVLLNCKNLDPLSYQTLLKDAMDEIELRSREYQENEDTSLYDNDVIWYFLPAMPGMENWFHNSSTQVSVTLELPSNLLGFAYYLVLSQGHLGYGVDFGCECFLDNNSGERIYIRTFTRTKFFGWLLRFDPSIHMMSDHLLFWYDPASCKQIMEAVEGIKSINDVNSTCYNPKLTFTFFIDETPYEDVAIKDCGVRWIYQEETVSSRISKSHDPEETISQINKLKLELFGTPPSNLELDETYDLRYSLEELMHIGFGVEHMNTLFGSTEEKSNS